MSNGAPDQHQGNGGTDRRPSDRALYWLISVLVVGVGINLLADVVAGSPWAWIAPLVFAVAVVVTMPWGGGGWLRWERHGSRRWTQLLAVLLIAGYLAIAWWGSTHNWSLRLLLVQAVLLWAAAVLVCWQTLRKQTSLNDVAAGVASLLFGMASLLAGMEDLRGGNTLVGVAFLLVGVAFLLAGVSALRNWATLVFASIWVMAMVMQLSERWDLVVAILLGGVVILLVGVAVPRSGDTLVGVAILLFGVAILLFGVAFLLLARAYNRAGPALVNLSIWLLGMAVALVGAAFLLFGVARLRGGDNLIGVAGLLAGVTVLYNGVTLVPRGRGPAAGEGRPAWSRFMSWLTTDRSQATSTTEPDTPAVPAVQTASETDEGHQATTQHSADSEDSSQNSSPDTPV